VNWAKIIIENIRKLAFLNKKGEPYGHEIS
jgi:hypothetical protein